MQHSAKLVLVISLFLSGLTFAQPDAAPPPAVRAAAQEVIDAALPALGAPDGWSHTLTEAETTALGCRVSVGLELPAPIAVYRLELRYGAAVYRVHAAADGGRALLCEERFAGLGWLTADSSGPESNSDGDSLINRADACPQIAGQASAQPPGCPQPSAHDRDGDGVPDSIDFCPEQAGPAAADGCSLLRDADGDSVPDSADLCPQEAGVIAADFALGCPADGSGSSVRRRGADEDCRVLGDEIRLYDGSRETPLSVSTAGDRDAAIVLGRDAAGDWHRLRDGWAAAAEVRLSGACYNIPILNTAVGMASGCFLGAQGTFADVRDGTAAGSARVGRIGAGESHAVLGSSFDEGWLFFKQGWVSRSAVELAGSCENLPPLDSERVGSGTVAFCPPKYSGYLPPRIAIGRANARVVSDSLANRLRAEPDFSAEQLGEILPATTIDAVLDGPACSGSFVWWQVESGGVIGWTVESDKNANAYYLAPLETETESSEPAVGQLPAAAEEAQPATLQIISSASSAKLNTVKILPARSAQGVVWSADESYLALISGGGAVEIYRDLNFAEQSADYHLPATLEPTVIAFSAAGRLAVGNADGRIYVAAAGGSAVDGAAGGYLPQQHTAAVRALRWSPGGERLAAVSGTAQSGLAGTAGTFKVWDLADFSPSASTAPPLLLNYAFPYRLVDLAFSHDGRWLAVTGESAADRQAALWIYSTADGRLQRVKRLVYSAGYSFVRAVPGAALGDFVYGNGDSLHHIRAADGSDSRFYQQPGGLLKSLRFRAGVIDGAELLFALTSRPLGEPAASDSLHIGNVLNSDSPISGLQIGSGAQIDFSPSGRFIAAAEPQENRVLILGVTDP